MKSYILFRLFTIVFLLAVFVVVSLYIYYGGWMWFVLVAFSIGMCITAHCVSKWAKKTGL